MSPDVTIKISFGGDGASVAVSPATDDAPAPMSIEELHGAAAAASPPRPSDALAGLSEGTFGAPAPLPIEVLLAGLQPGTPMPQGVGAPQAGDPPGPMPIEQLGAAGAASLPGPGPAAPKTTARRRRSPSTR